MQKVVTSSCWVIGQVSPWMLSGRQCFWSARPIEWLVVAGANRMCALTMVVAVTRMERPSLPVVCLPMVRCCWPCRRAPRGGIIHVPDTGMSSSLMLFMFSACSSSKRHRIRGPVARHGITGHGAAVAGLWLLVPLAGKGSRWCRGRKIWIGRPWLDPRITLRHIKSKPPIWNLADLVGSRRWGRFGHWI